MTVAIVVLLGLMRLPSPGLRTGSPWTFQTSYVSFPRPGCWEVDATAAGQTLRFVVNIP